MAGTELPSECKNIKFDIHSKTNLLKRIYMDAIIVKNPLVAQLDSATDSDSGGRGFKSLRAGQYGSPFEE